MKTNRLRNYSTCISLFMALMMLEFGSMVIAAEEAKNPPSLSDYIRPLVGTQGEGNTYPGPTAPFGRVQPGPDTNGEKFCGYDYTDPFIHGFSMTHLSGTGWWDLGDF